MHRTGWPFGILSGLCCAYAWWKRGGPERIAATNYVAGVLLTGVAQNASATWWSSVDAGVFDVEVVRIGLLAIALMAERYWPL